MSAAWRTAAETCDLVARRETTAVEVCRDALDRIGAVDPSIGAFLAVDPEAALRQAEAVDRRIGAGEALPLAGVPIAVKDNIVTRGLPTTAGSRMLEGWRPGYDATVVRRLSEAGAVILGKTNCDEFAMGSSTEHSAFGPTRNPWDPARTPGGSSGGSAASVAARLAPVALGSDTGGSVRQPASFCGLLGLKPTWGRVSRFGLVAFASSLDQIGPIALTASDAARTLAAIAGPDAADSTSAPGEVPDFGGRLTGSVAGLRIGVPAGLFDLVDPAVGRLAGEALAALAGRGASLVDVALPHLDLGVPIYYLVATAEASSNLARFDGVRYGRRAADEDGAMTLEAMYERTRSAGFGPEVKRRILLGTFVLSAGYRDAYYVKAQRARALVARDYYEAFAAVDVVATPTSPTPPFPLGERLDDPLSMYLADVFTVGPSLAGLPALSVPCGFAPKDLPVGLQLVGRPYDEATLLGVADAYERDCPWWRRVPPAAAPPTI